MTNEPSPRPWQVRYGDTVADATGAKVAACWRPENAALVVDAVNTLAEFEAAHMEFPDFRPVIIAAGQRDAAIAERDRLRDLVRRMADLSESLLANYEYRYREDANSMAFVENTRRFLREARAAIGEDAK